MSAVLPLQEFTGREPRFTSRGMTIRIMAMAFPNSSAFRRCAPGGEKSPVMAFAAPRTTPSAWRPAWLRSSLVAATLALTGCASLLVAPSTDLSHVAVPSVWSNGTAAASPTALAGWWQRFHDPQLTALVTQALQANNDVRTAQAALRQSRAQRDVAAAGLLPTVNAAAAAATRQGRWQRLRSMRIRPASMRAGSRTSSAASRAASPPRTPIPAAAAVSLDNVQVSIAAEVAVTYMDLCALELRLAIARDNLASQEETLQIAQWRAQAGLTTSLDVEQARTSTEITRAQIPALDASIAQARSSPGHPDRRHARGDAGVVAGSGGPCRPRTTILHSHSPRRRCASVPTCARRSIS